MRSRIIVIIPANNEVKSLPMVLRAIPRDLVQNIIVSDNASTDGTGEAAMTNGAIVVREEERGYGAACLAAMDYISDNELNPEVIVFMDGDYSDYPEEMKELVLPITEGNYDMVIGSRALGDREKGSMTIPQVFGNKLATGLMKAIFGATFTDLGPFRAIRYSKLLALKMKDRNYGWTIEMQIKAHKLGLKYIERPVSYRQRIGKSKVSGTVKGTVMAGYKILLTIAKYI